MCRCVCSCRGNLVYIEGQVASDCFYSGSLPSFLSPTSLPSEVIDLLSVPRVDPINVIDSLGSGEPFDTDTSTLASNVDGLEELSSYKYFIYHYSLYIFLE